MVSEAIIFSHDKMIRAIAHDAVPYDDRDDALVDGQMCVWLHYDDYEDQGQAWSSHRAWMLQRIRWAILEGQRTRDHRRRVGVTDTISIDMPAPWLSTNGDGTQETVGGILAAEPGDAPEQRALDAETVRECLATLSPDDRLLFDALVGGMTGADYAKSIGVTESRISQRLRGIRERFTRQREAEG